MTDTMYDAVNWHLIPHTALYVAVYANGQFKANLSDVTAAFPTARIYQIDVDGSDPDASIKDVETGDITVAGLPAAVNHRFSIHPTALTRVYCNLSTWPAAKAAIKKWVPPSQQTQIRWWIANPTGKPHFVPGSNATQYLWTPDYDASVVGHNFEN